MFKWFRDIPKRNAIAKLYLKHYSEKDNWVCDEVKFSFSSMGCRVKDDISFYFNEDSDVRIENIKSLFEWLIECEKEIDDGERYWKKTIDFEKSRKGISIDYALWTWRKLIELGYDSELMVGEQFIDEKYKGHAWVTYTSGKRRFLIETVSKNIECMIYNIEDVEDVYIPWLSMDQDFQNRLYGGYCSAIKRNKNQ